MNRIYSLVWNRALRALQVASEMTTSVGGGGASAGSGASSPRKHPLALACIAALALGAFALPALAAMCTPSTTQICGSNGKNGSAGTYASGAGYTGGAGGVGYSGQVGVTASSALTVKAGYGVMGGYGGNGGNGGKGVTYVGSTGVGKNGGPGGSGGSGGVGINTNGYDINNAGAITGGRGGTGGAGGAGGGGQARGGGGGRGGSGGSGGAGIYGENFKLTNTGVITGGAGGTGGTGGTGGSVGGAAGSGGYGSYGGPGVKGSRFTLINSGAITGGAGGNGSLGAFGGYGVFATGFSTVVTTGTIAGGAGGQGAAGATNNGPQGDAVLFSNGGNTLTLEVGASISGNIQSVSGTISGGDTLILGDDTLGSNPQPGGSGSLDIGTVSGFANYSKTGTSTWTLTGTGTSDQNWAVIDGTLAGDATSIVGNITFNPVAGDTAAVTFDQGSGNANSPASAAYAGAITGDGSMTKIDNGTLTLTDANTYTGGTGVEAGTLALSGSGSIADASDVNVAAGATFDISGTTGASIQSLDGAGNVNLGNQTLTLTAAGNKNDTGGGVFAGVIYGAGGLTVSGGTETLSGFNTFTGATTIDGGATIIGAPTFGAAFLGLPGANTNTLNLDNGTLDLANSQWSTAAAVNLGSGGGAFSITGTTGGQARYLQLTGLISGSGGLAFSADGFDTFTLSNGGNTFTGGVTMTRLTPFAQGATPSLTVTATGALGTGDVTLNTGTNLQFLSPGNDANGNPIGVDAGKRTINLFGDNNVSFMANTTAGSATITAAKQSMGGSYITFQGGSDAGTSNISVGASDVLVFSSGSGTVPAASAASAVIYNGLGAGAFALTKFMSGSTAANATISNTYGVTSFYAGSRAGSASITNGYESATELNDAAAGTAHFTNAGSSYLPGAAKANNMNYFRGGVLEIIGSTDASRATVVNNSGGAVYVSAYRGQSAVDPSIGSLSGAGTVLLGANFNASNTATPFTLTLGALGNNDTISGVIRDDALVATGGVSVGDGILKAGTGTLTLDGINTYTGLTEVQDGTLVVGDAANLTAAIAGSAQIDSGTTLEGFGTVGATGATAEVKSGAILAPGSSSQVGTLSFGGNLTLDGGSVFDVALGAPAASNPSTTAGLSSHVAVAGTLTFNGATTLNFTNPLNAGPGLYNLASYGTLVTNGCAFTGTTGCLTLGTVPAGTKASDFTITNNAAGKQIDLYDSAAQTQLDIWAPNGKLVNGAVSPIGGSGAWSTTSATWTDPQGDYGPTTMYPQPGFAIFQGTQSDGTACAVQQCVVTIVEGANGSAPVIANGLQFAVDGYSVVGDALTLVRDTSGNAPVINVGDGSSTSAGDTATISAVLAGTDGFTKTDFGTLVLSGANTFTGGITGDGGTLELATASARGNAGGIMVDNTANDGATLKIDSGVTFDAQFWVNNGGVLDNAGAIGSAAREETVQGLVGLGTVENHAGGTILGSMGVFLDAGGVVDNDGAGTSITATGLSAPGYGVLVQNGTGTVTNTNGALINGAEYGVYLVDGGEVDNGAGSTIEGNGGAVVAVNAATTVRNAGTLKGGAFLDANAANVVELTAGGVIDGNLGVSGAASTLTLDGSNASPQLYSNAVTGTTTFDGALTKAGSGTWVIDNDGLASVANTTINAGTLQVGNGGTTGSIGNGNVADAGSLIFDLGNGLTYGGVISGTGTLTQQGSGTLTLTGANTFSGGTRINTGAVDVGNNTALGTGTVAMAAGTTLGFTATGLNVANAFALSGDPTFDVASATQTDTVSGVVADGSAPGVLAKTGAGTLILTGANTYTGGTTISAGTLQVGNGGNAGAIGSGAITDNGALTYDLSGAVTLDNALSGTGTLNQQGAGTLTVNADDGAFAGTTHVNAGALVVGDATHTNAALGGMVDVAKGTMVGGLGTLGGLDVSGALDQQATIGQIGTLHVTGNATFEAGSTFNVQANAAGQSDLLAAGGDVAIKGGNTVVLADPGNWAPRTTYTIITAGKGVTGTFTGVSDNQAFLTPVLTYNPDSVELALERNDINFGSVTTNPNQQAVATVADALGWGSPLYNALVVLDAADAQVAFNQLSGEFDASQQTARINDSRYIREAMNERLRAGDNDPTAAKQGDSNVTAWAHAWGHWGTTDSDGNAAGLADNGDGLLIGADTPIGNQARIGITGGASRNSLSVRDRSSWGRQTSTWLGGFAGYDAGAFGLRGGIAYAWDQIPTNRMVNFPGFTDRLSGNATGDTLTGFVEGSWTFHLSGATVTPFLNLAHTKVETDASTEAGGAAALIAGQHSENVSFSTLGARGQIDFAHHLNLHGELGWQHAYGDVTPDRSLQFVAGGPAFTEYGVPVAKNAGLGRIGLGWHQGNVAIDANYEGLAGNGVKDQAAKLSVSVTF